MHNEQSLSRNDAHTYNLCAYSIGSTLYAALLLWAPLLIP